MTSSQTELLALLKRFDHQVGDTITVDDSDYKVVFELYEKGYFKGLRPLGQLWEVEIVKL